MSIVSVRVSKELKEKMKRYDVNWSEEIRKAIIERIREIERAKAAEEISNIIERLPKAEAGFSVKSVREDRDSR
ncbi:MAG: type II toxin-antitoxin system CcdA family antitoxin [Candidatus Bathyarchaeia archaeon]